MKLKDFWNKMIRKNYTSRKEQDIFKIAESIKDQYPPNTSLHFIVRDLKNYEIAGKD